MDVRIEVDTRLADALRAVPASLPQHIQPALLRSAGIAAREMKRGAAKAYSTLTNSITSEMTGPLSARAFSGVNYGPYVDQGTSGGGMVPAQSLMDWMRVVGITTGDEAEDNRTLFLIQRSIYRKGSKAQPFVEPARAKTEAEVHQRLDAAVQSSLRAAGLV